MDDDNFPLQVGGYRFDCFYQQGHFPNGRWQKSESGTIHVAVCKCGRGVYGSSLDDAVDKLRASYSILRENEHFHFEGSPRFNVILASDGSWIMGTVTEPDLLEHYIETEETMPELEYTLTVQKLTPGDYKVNAFPTTGDSGVLHRLYPSWTDFKAAFAPVMEETEAQWLQSTVENATYGIPLFQSRRVVTGAFIKNLGFE